MAVLEEGRADVQEATAQPAPSRARTLMLVLAVIAFNAFGNLVLTIGLRQAPEHLGTNPLGYLEIMVNPVVAAGIALLALWLLTRMALMSWADLSFVLPVTAAGYVLATWLGHAFLNETVSFNRWLGTILIFAGAMLVGLSASRTNTTGVAR